MHILIIEDDPSTVVNYRMIVDSIGVTSVTAIDNFRQAENHIKNNLVDIVIADIYLGEKSGLDLLPSLNEIDCSIIVVTGYPTDAHLKTVLKYKVDRFLTKPIGERTLKHELIYIIEERKSNSGISFLFHYNKNRIMRIPFSDIIYFETEGNYTTLFKKDKKIVIKKSLRNVSKGLPDYFQHVYRNILINTHHIQSVDYTKNEIQLVNGRTLNLGNAYKKQLKQFMLDQFSVI